MEPLDVLDFIELHPFTKRWHDLGLRDSDLHQLQRTIMAAPIAAPVIAGTGGLRKLRFAPRRGSKGKSGALRVCYVYFKEYTVVLLAIIYPKSERSNLSKQETNAIRKLIERVRSELEKRLTTP
jgi:hypothetical protein